MQQRHVTEVNEAAALWFATANKHLPVGLLTMAGLSVPGAAWANEGGGLAADMSFIWVVPFVGMLLSIAIMPMVANHWWERHRNQLLVAMSWASPILIYFGWLAFTSDHGSEAVHGLIHAIEEYISFIALLGSLFVISGGILVKGDLEGKPTVNTAFLAIGAVLANFIGTTGASMLLIRPLLRTNSQREYVKHIPIFFIFLVSNIGGALTPIGDPPLFLGYLRGVPFFWTLENLWMVWLVPVGILLALFFVVDSYFYKREPSAGLKRDRSDAAPLGMEGGNELRIARRGGGRGVVALPRARGHRFPQLLRAGSGHGRPRCCFDVEDPQDPPPDQWVYLRAHP